MIETVAIPILVKAVDFLFDEARRVLDERRKRRETESARALQNRNGEKGNVSVEHKYRNRIDNKDKAMKMAVKDDMLRFYQNEIEHLVSLLEIYARNYHLAKEQYARWGSALVPPIIIGNLEEAEESILKTSIKLQKLLSVLYGKEVIAVAEIESDSNVG